jgi:hypothetical protein
MVMESLQNDASLLPIEVPLSPEYDNENTEIDRNSLSKLGFGVLPDRRIILGGKILQGVTLPKSTSKQLSIITRLLTWYGPCLEVQKGGYQLNDRCFSKRENEFLRLLSESLTNLRFKYIL